MTHKKIRKSVSIWCDDSTAYISARVVVEKYVRKNYKIYFYTRESNINYIKNAFPMLHVISIQEIDNKLANYLHHFYRLFLTPDDFSRVYRQIVKVEFYGKFLSKFSIFLRLYKLNEKNFIKNYRKLFSCYGYDFKSKLVISFSRVSRPYLFINPRIRHIAILESWDHTMKEPWYFSPNRTLVWNSDMKEDVIFYQNVSNVHQIHPTKFLYINNIKSNGFLIKDVELKLKEHYKKDLEYIDNKNYVMYSVAFSEFNVDGFKGEIKFIRELHKACQILNKILFIKPKPFGNLGKLEEIFKRDPDVYVGRVPLFNDSTELLSNTYNNYRMLLVEKSELVVDIGSSFMIDGSLMGGDVLMVKVSKGGYSFLFDNRDVSKGHLKSFQSDWFNYDGNIHKLAHAIQHKEKNISEKVRRWIVKWDR